tara:strand:- start:776 stop:919 length:144 start_codon:yes stop_codon:yes gene_type:complete
MENNENKINKINKINNDKLKNQEYIKELIKQYPKWGAEYKKRNNFIS